MTDINFYSSSRSRKIVAEAIESDHDTKWIRIRILDDYDEIGTINIFGADTVINTKHEMEAA